MIPFPNMPSNLRVPLFYGEMDNSMAGYFVQNQRSLLIGQKLAAAPVGYDIPFIVSSVDHAIALCGRGSMLHRMVARYRESDPVGELWVIAVADAAGGATATGTITAAGTATAAGTIPLYIAGQRVSVGVTAGDTAAMVATAINAAINAALDLPVTSTVAAAVVTATARWKGLTGNDIAMLDCYRGNAGGESLPAGITLTYSGSGFLAGGTANPTLTGAITGMGDEEYDFVIHPYTDSASLDAFKVEYNDASGRWSYARQVYGHCYTALRGTLSTLVAAGGLRNDPHHTIAGFEVDVQHPNWEYAAAYGARNAVFLKVDPARPTQTGVLTNLMAPRPGMRFILTERQSLLTYGIATSYVSGGDVAIERAITTYQKNSFNVADASYLDSETMHTSAYVLRNLRSVITQKYARHKLADDGTRFAGGSAIVTPKTIRGELIAQYRQMELDGIVENSAAFEANLIVERNSGNPNRLDVLYPPDYVNQLRIFAVLNQFRLQYPAAA